MHPTTAFYHDERCLWHTTGEAVLVMPVGGWLQPPAGGGHAESTVPFCGLAVVETLGGVRTAVEDPFGELFVAHQPDGRVADFQRSLVDEMAEMLV